MAHTHGQFLSQNGLGESLFVVFVDSDLIDLVPLGKSCENDLMTLRHNYDAHTKLHCTHRTSELSRPIVKILGLFKTEKHINM